MDRFGRHVGTEAHLVISFVGHLFGAAAMFTACLLVAWFSALLVHFLHSSHPFPDPVYQAITTLETWLFYFDMLVCGMVLAFGLRKLVTDAMENVR